MKHLYLINMTILANIFLKTNNKVLKNLRDIFKLLNAID